MVTTAVKLPAAVGFTDSVTVSAVAVAAVTVPTAPLFKTTVFCDGVVLNPNPLIVTVSALIPCEVVFAVTTGFTVATWTAEPLVCEFVVTIAVRLPTAFGAVDRATVNEVAVAAVTAPTAPLLNVTVLLAAVGLKPKPLIVTVVPLMAKLPTALVTTGATVAICTAEPLSELFVVTTAVKLPAVVGLVLKVTVIAVLDALVTDPTAPLLTATVLLPGVVSKPTPLITTVEASAAMVKPAFALTTGVTLAT